MLGEYSVMYSVPMFNFITVFGNYGERNAISPRATGLPRILSKAALGLLDQFV